MRCLVVPDWKMNCDLPCIADCALEPLYIAGYCFDKHACTCKMAKCIKPVCNVPQNKPVCRSSTRWRPAAGGSATASRAAYRRRRSTPAAARTPSRRRSLLTRGQWTWATPARSFVNCDVAPGPRLQRRADPGGWTLERMETARPPSSSPPPHSHTHRRTESSCLAFGFGAIRG